MKTPEEQLELYREAVDAVGGIAAHARRLGFSERHGGRLYSGASPLHEGILADTARALIAHATRCRELERALSPDFKGNLTTDQASALGKPDARRFDMRDGSSIEFAGRVEPITGKEIGRDG